MDRDYSNVHQDVKLLYQLGLMQKDEKDDKFSVPWDVIVTEITLSVAKNTKTIQRQTNHNLPRAVNG